MIQDKNTPQPMAGAAPARAAQSAPASSFNISEFIGYVVRHWYWIVISIALCLAYAAYSLMKQTPAYASTITILFKTDSNKGGTMQIPDMSSLGISSGNPDLADEMITIRSVGMVTEVVDALDLNNAYYVREALHKKLLYKSSPILVQNMTPAAEQTPEMQNVWYSFNVTMTSPDSYLLSDFSAGEKGLVLKGKTGTTVETPVGPFKITTTQNFDDTYLNEPVTFSHVPPEAAAAGIAGSISFLLAEYSESIIHLTVTDPSPLRAHDILETLVDVYNKRWILERNQAAMNTSRFIDERLAVIESDLGDVDNNISSYKSSNLIGDGGSVASGAVARLAQSQAAKMELQNRLTLVKYIRREVQNASLDTPLPNPAGIEGTTVEGQLSEYNRIVMERNRMLATSSESNPVVQDRTNTLNTLRNTMVSSIDNLILSLNSQMSLLDVQESRSTSDLMRSPSQAKYLLSVERQQKVKESLYLFLLQKREENELQQAFTPANTRVINRPGVSSTPVSPNRNNTLLIALGVGLVLPIVIMFLLKNFDTKVRSRRDLSTLRTPYLGEIPFNGKRMSWWKRWLKRGDETSKRPIVVKASSRDTINEAFRVVRSNLEFIGNMPGAVPGGADIRTIMVTSLYAGSGKTFIALNLASALAAKGKKVLLMDLDLRKGTMSQIVGTHRQGIANYIIGRAQVNDIIVHDVDNVEGLDMIPVGSLPPNPSELLYSPKFEEIIEELKKQYAYIIVDCPPVEIIADTHIISRFADMTVFVIRAGLFEKADLAKLHEFYDENRFRNLSVVLNGVDASSTYYGLRKYARYYSSGYITDAK